MCGFTGIIGRKISYETIQEMLSSIKHRGPDNLNILQNNNINIGFARLSINDLSDHSNQPIIDNNNILIFNGEIYNFRELNKKYRFNEINNSDTYTLFNMLKLKGKDCLGEINGMFSFLFINKETNYMLAARDLLGEKPFFYSILADNSILFGSELKSLLKSNLIDPKIDSNQLIHYLKFLHVNPLKTIYKNINTLPPSNYIEIQNKNIKINRYWSYKKEPMINNNFELAKDKFKKVITKSIDRQISADVEVGAFLSGGIDSSIVVASTNQSLLKSKKLKTFSFGYLNRSELADARLVSNTFNTKHYELYEQDLAISDLLISLSKIYDEPFADSASIGNYVLSNFAKNYVKSCIGGDGGDELFGGYVSIYEKIEYLKNLNVDNKIYNLLYKNISKLPSKIYKHSNTLRRFFDSKEFTTNVQEGYLSLRSHTNNKSIEQLGLPMNGFSMNLENQYTDNNLENFMSNDINFYLCGDILYLKDRITMSQSLELRSPFLDKEVIEFSEEVPIKYKYKNSSGKILLKSAYKDILPSRILNKKKQGFGAPVYEWLKREDIKQLVFDLLEKKDNKIFDYIDYKNTQKKLKKNDYSKWTLLILSLWFNEWN